MFSLSLRKFFGFTQLPLLPKFNIGNLTPRLQGDRAAHTWSMHRKGAIILINRISNQEKTPPGGGRRGLNWLGRFGGGGGSVPTKLPSQVTTQVNVPQKNLAVSAGHTASRTMQGGSGESPPGPPHPTPKRLHPLD